VIGSLVLAKDSDDEGAGEQMGNNMVEDEGY